MVTINFTIVVQLALFLTFLFGLQKWVLAPMLKTMDDREDTITTNKKSAQIDRKAAEELETEYARSIAQARRDASNVLRNAQAQALLRRNEQIRKRREEVDAVVMAHGEEALQQVEAQRAHFGAVVPLVTEAMLARLRVKENG
jgi:F-type H+-transporting ATPase subunit b